MDIDMSAHICILEYMTSILRGQFVLDQITINSKIVHVVSPRIYKLICRNLPKFIVCDLCRVIGIPDLHVFL